MQIARRRSPRWFAHGAEISARRIAIWSGTFPQDFFSKFIFRRGDRPRASFVAKWLNAFDVYAIFGVILVSLCNYSISILKILKIFKIIFSKKKGISQDHASSCVYTRVCIDLYSYCGKSPRTI